MQSLSAWVSLKSLLNTLSKKLSVKMQFTVTVFETMLLEGTSVLSPAAIKELKFQ